MPRTVALLSLGGAPGVTVTAMALAATWPEEPGALLVEADASGGDIGTWHRMFASPGLTDLAAAVRHDQRPDGAGEGPLEHTQVLEGGLPVCPAPASADRADGAVRLLAQNAASLTAASGHVTVLDLGRLTPRSATAHLAAHADAALLLVRDDLAQLRRLQESARYLFETLPRAWTVIAGGSGSTAEIAATVGLRVWGRMPTDPRSAAFLRGEAGLRRPERRPLLRAAASLSRALVREAATPPVRMEVPR
ncbi:hypothetical protein KIK06_08845 [Nocardiopsis sp. EMB25]|uniref:hypothetical protein n=2 Tax=Nocardiopsis TaxID=2013 RepID=UPI002283D199|nr:hypothetical protein [Nocardiopsis sp. EMB25]MCY9783998.1 hypothetical protein [Nocardiopsis sp. EMB25]